jgi:hypothetical protein
MQNRGGRSSDSDARELAETGLLGGDLCNRASADICAQQFHEPVHLFEGWFGETLASLFLDQFLDHTGEAVAPTNAGFDPRLSLGGVGIDGLAQLLTGRIASRTRFRQCDVGKRS